MYDVVIVGARVAGATLAIKLANSGMKTLLIDKTIFPSATVSSHYFRGGGFGAVLKDLDLLEVVLAEDTPKLTHEAHFREGSPIEQVRPCSNPGELGYNMAARRITTDRILINHARQLDNLEIKENTKFLNVVKDGTRVSGIQIETPKGRETIECKLLVGADGRRSHVADQVNPEVEEQSELMRMLAYQHFESLGTFDGGDPYCAEFSINDNEVAYLFPSDNNTTCLAISVGLSQYNSVKRGFSTNFLRMFRKHQGFAPRLEHAKPITSVGKSGLVKNYIRKPYGPGWVLAGDAAVHLDPWTGMGMDLHGQSSLRLSSEIVNHLDGDTLALDRFHQWRNEFINEPYRFTVDNSADIRTVRSGSKQH